jgi:DNA-binding response OmpR family regulator
MHSPAGWAQRATIVLVEDTEGVRKFLRTVLEMEGYRVVEARSGTLAVSLIEAIVERVDLLITDVLLPYLSGFELARWTRSLHPEIRVLYMSGYPQAEFIDRSWADPHGAFIQKPFTAAKFASAVRAVLGRGSA